MVLRWRTIGAGYYDYQIQRYVDPIGLDQAAFNLKLRHLELTGQDQHIERKTLDDYYDKIRWGNSKNNPYKFNEHQN